ncbi:MAG: GNAT family N-acetyltransferase [Myxococcales bacterium]|nr:GNAT family N-acetyltransferase [Myxococcales bacterium]
MGSYRVEEAGRVLRPAKLADLPAMTEIYNQAVHERSATADPYPRDVDDRRSWFDRYQWEAGHPLIVWEEAGQVQAYCGLSSFRSKAGYDGCVEMTLYVRQCQRGRGIGRAIGEAMVELGRGLGNRVILALVFADNSGSNGLFSRLGFSLSGHFPEAVLFPGEHEHPRDVGIWHLRL